MEEVKEAQKDRIVAMLLKGSIYGLPGSDGTVRNDVVRPTIYALHFFLRLCIFLCGELRMNDFLWFTTSTGNDA